MFVAALSSYNHWWSQVQARVVHDQVSLHCHSPYQIEESVKNLSRMIFQSQLWVLLLLSLRYNGQMVSVMTRCHQLFVLEKYFTRNQVI